MFTKFNRLTILIFAMAMVVSACAPFKVLAEPGTPTPTAVPTNFPTPLVPTADPTSTPVLSSSPTPVLTTLEGVSPSIITLDNNNKTITLHPNETFLLKLGDDVYQWDIQIDNQAVVSRVKNIAVIRGAQGVYQALQAGTATLTADGDPLCRQSKPACAMPSIRFMLHIEVLS